jgi:hypothetical protein
MKRNSWLLSGILLLSCASLAQAQIVFQKPVTITGSATQVSTLGSYVDAVGGNDSSSSAIIVDAGSGLTMSNVTFNSIFSDPGITFSSPTGIGGGTNGSGSTATPFLTVLDDVAFVGDFNAADVQTGTVTLNNLAVGDLYQVQVFNDGGSLTVINGANTQETSNSYTIGTFTAVGPGTTTSESFTFDSSASGIGEIDAVSLRDITSVAEPSTYLFMGLGLVSFAVLARFRKQAA